MIKYLRIIPFIPFILFTLIIIILPFKVNDDCIMQAIQNAPYFGGIVLTCTLCIFLCIWHLFRIKIGRISIVDIVLVAFVSYTLYNTFWRQGGTDYKLLLEMFIMVFLYVSVRLCDQGMRRAVVYLLLVSALAQAIYGQLQLYGVYSSHHSLFNITGSFFNPAPYAGYLCAIFPIAFVLYIDRPKATTSESGWLKGVVLQLSKLIPIITLISIVIVLPATQSRAAWVGVAFSAVFLLLKASPKCYLYMHEIQHFSLRQWLVAIALFILLIGCFVLVYLFKKNSADGRLLIWSISLNMVHDKALLGWGHNGFEAFFMNAQADFFRANPQHIGVVLADNVQYAYNELLKLLVEQGGIGVLLIIATLVSLLTTKSQDVSVRGSQWGIIALVVFSMFSYPSDILPIKMIFVLYLGIISPHSATMLTLGRKWARGLLITSIIGLALLVPYGKTKVESYYTALVSWRDASDIYRVEAYEECLDDFEAASPILKTNGDFLIQYGKALTMANHHSEAIVILNKAKRHLNNTILYTALGDSYTKTAQYTEAEEAYWQAYHMVPNRFYPLYLLAKMYHESDQDDKAVTVANKILEKHVKVESSAIDDIKAYALQLTKPNE